VSFELDESAQVISYVQPKERCQWQVTAGRKPDASEAKQRYLAYGGTAFVLGDAAREVGLRERRFSGKLRDGTTRFYVYAYRYYLSWIGNWITPSPTNSIHSQTCSRSFYSVETL
jgi:RHS repeat-associated protein